MEPSNPFKHGPADGERLLYGSYSDGLVARYYAGPWSRQQIIELRGHIDVYSAAPLRELLIQATESGFTQLVLSLEIEFLDSTGLGVLIGALKRMRARDGYLDLICTQERVLKIFRITGLRKVFGIFGSITEMLAAYSSPYEREPQPSSDDIDRVVEAGDWIPVRLYMQDAEHHKRVETALRALVEEFGLEINYEFPPSYHSYWREFGARFRSRNTSPAVVDQRMADLERSIRIHLVNERGPTVNEAEAKAVAILITSLRETPDAVIQIGTMLLLKIKGKILARNLSPVELIYYERNPIHFKDPRAALRALEDLTQERRIAERLDAGLNGQVRGRHPKTKTIHLARAVRQVGSTAGGSQFLIAECGRTQAPLLEVDGMISCGSCRRLVITQ